MRRKNKRKSSRHHSPLISLPNTYTRKNLRKTSHRIPPNPRLNSHAQTTAAAQVTPRARPTRYDIKVSLSRTSTNFDASRDARDVSTRAGPQVRRSPETDNVPPPPDISARACAPARVPEPPHRPQAPPTPLAQTVLPPLPPHRSAFSAARSPPPPASAGLIS